MCINQQLGVCTMMEGLAFMGQGPSLLLHLMSKIPSLAPFRCLQGLQWSLLGVGAGFGKSGRHLIGAASTPMCSSFHNRGRPRQSGTLLATRQTLEPARVSTGLRKWTLCVWKMKPIALHGHNRSITQIKFNLAGDLLFSSAKDEYPSVWYAINGERLGTFGSPGDPECHTGAVWCIDVDHETRQLISGAGDNSFRLWDVNTGRQVARIETKSAVRSCNFSYSSSLVAYTTDKSMKQPSILNIIDVRQFGQDKPVFQRVLPPNAPKITSSLWGTLDEKYVTGHETGDIGLWDIKADKRLNLCSDHTKQITDMQLSADRTMMITSSKDTTAKLFDVDTLECLKTYKTERPVNSAAISPKFDHVVLGGGQEAMDVTTTSSRVGKFDARFFWLIWEEEFGRVKGHFGPINSVAFTPDGNGYASGGEDGYVRLHTFDPSYFEYDQNMKREVLPPA